MATTAAITSNKTMIADSAATISAVPMASDLNTRSGTRRVLMADNSVQDTPSGLSHVYMHGDDVHNGINITDDSRPRPPLAAYWSRRSTLPFLKDQGAYRRSMRY